MNVTDVDSSGLSHLGRRDEQRTNSWLALFLRFGEGTVGYYLVVSKYLVHYVPVCRKDFHIPCCGRSQSRRARGMSIFR
jgi:hypothetical protein